MEFISTRSACAKVEPVFLPPGHTIIRPTESTDYHDQVGLTPAMRRTWWRELMEERLFPSPPIASRSLQERRHSSTAMDPRWSSTRHPTIRYRSPPATVETALRAEWCARYPEQTRNLLASECVCAAARTLLVVERRIGFREQI